jgi:hypothetical protein
MGSKNDRLTHGDGYRRGNLESARFVLEHAENETLACLRQWARRIVSADSSPAAVPAQPKCIRDSAGEQCVMCTMLSFPSHRCAVTG